MNATIANSAVIPETITEPIRVEIIGEPNPLLPIRPMRRHGNWQVEIEPCKQSEDVLALLQAPIGTAYQAGFVGWHRGQVLAYGVKPRDAAEALLAKAA